MKLLLINQAHDRVPAAWLKRWVSALSRRLVKRGYRSLTRKELVVVFVTSGEIRRLNRLHRRKDYATDILSFAPPDDTSIGELVLCLPYLRRQSRRTGLSEHGELGYMLIHGVLHLLGHDHATVAEEAKMFALQDTLHADLERKIGLR